MARRFAEKIFRGETREAMRAVSNHKRGGILPLTEDAVALYKEKHPARQPANVSAMINGEPPPDVDPIVFAALDMVV
jgi:hypothetical protein